MQGFQDDPCDDWSDRPLSRLGSDSPSGGGNTGGMDLVRLPSNGGIRRGEMQYVGTGVRTGKWSIREANRRR
jgi:hypothetical protein